MNDSHAAMIIKLLEEISRKLDDVYSALAYADNGDVVTAIEKLTREVKKIGR